MFDCCRTGVFFEAMQLGRSLGLCIRISISRACGKQPKFWCGSGAGGSVRG